MMETNKFNTPILFLIFNRPDTTFKVFEEIRKIKPAKLYIAADGPRPNVIGEEEKCTASRNIIKQVDWDCDVKTLFREKNLGCKIAVSSAISWFFENVEEGIILEDDTFPTQSFFWFCQELLDFYRNDSRIMHISGNNFQLGKIRGEGSYYFSKYNHIWGWATWKRAWRFYDVSLNTFPIFVQRKVIKNIFRRVKAQRYWFNKLKGVYKKNIDTWDFQWAYTIWCQNGLCILPNTNLVSNIGFGDEATHTKFKISNLGNIPLGEMTFPLKHPLFVLQDMAADDFADPPKSGTLRHGATGAQRPTKCHR